MFSYRRFKATTPQGGSIEFSVESRFLEKLEGEAFRQEVAHEAWRKMFETHDSKGRRLEGNQAQMLRQICQKNGVEETKAAFTRYLVFEELA